VPIFLDRSVFFQLIPRLTTENSTSALAAAITG
jgi:hypothetical protein